MDIVLLVIVGGVVTYFLASKYLGEAPSTAEIINDAVSDETPTEDYSGLTKAQLLDVAKHQGVKVTARSTKAQIIELLK